MNKSFNSPNEVAVFAGGCFWCTEAVFERLDGVVFVKPGYAGGTKENPTYEEVSTGETGYAEVSKIEFDPAKISFEDLLTVFFFSHDPTTLNRQGNDVGTQYRSVIFYTTDEQKKEAEKFIQNLNLRNAYDKTVITDLLPLDKFYEAEDYHKKYYESHKDQPYCRIVIEPKIEKLKKQYGKLISEKY